ncbi:sugar phosphate isomerase/epimerase family protein [Paenibacillus roseipurpureus]|uniref:Sugar phosphate isomerase/epimerase n=1 Tax=Paenibacillus roseopurpureus TaxID=2918901 RepID=A0AA96RM16_9BACL|nr:sugar phosphate isomerase/epimerase [Paenibacillus sp. MBLB1832]WNR45994.1 sugar phosphate isomerase/epimerase [Paenibacillus sp. MBLB1832]
MKIAVFTVMLPNYSPIQALDVLHKAGYNGVEWRVTKLNPALTRETPSFWGNNLATIDTSSTSQQLADLREETSRRGLVATNLGSYLQVGDLEGVDRDMRIAQALGSPSIRVGVPMYDRTHTYGELLAKGRAYLSGVQSLSQHYGIKGLIETHMGNIAASASGARRLVEGFNPAHIGVIHDAGNMVYEGFENYRMGLEILGEYLGHVHIKNARWVLDKDSNGVKWRAESAPLREGSAELKQLLADLRAVGYDGWLSFEDFSDPAPTQASLATNLAYLKNLI